jgi:organic hydroperoxide reductase OsmC/OhrA
MSTQPPHQPASGVVSEFAIAIEQIQDFEFRVKFDKDQFAELAMDEPAPLGQDRAPNASRVLAAAVGNCLSASLLFCLKKARIEAGPIHTMVRTRIARNEQGRLRIAGVEVEIDPHIAAGDMQRAARCLEVFEDYCVVTQSVRQGIDVRITVLEHHQDQPQG